ncbi:MAG: lactate utilization protein [Candidatus Atribacteria bacterium]|nr:lactate utilization protein [Candidatus Atribacteria bacterium]
MDQNIFKDIYFKRCQLALTALKANGFEVLYADNSKEALDKVMSLIPKEAKVGVGGSVTVRDIGLVEAIERQGNTIFMDWEKPIELKEKIKVRKEALTSDIYLTSSNAITFQGQLVNIDGTGNRVSAMIFGPKKVIIVAGVNKLVDTLDEALARTKNITSPLIGKRLNLKAPCVLTGKCTDCNSPDRMCRVTVILEKKPRLSDITIVLVGENLGY